MLEKALPGQASAERPRSRILQPELPGLECGALRRQSKSPSTGQKGTPAHNSCKMLHVLRGKSVNRL